MDFNKLCTHCMTEVSGIPGQPCPKCGHTFHGGATAPHLLAPFSILQGKYLVGDVLGEGGFGITYIGMDLNLEMKVAIKEFYPNGYCSREAKTTTTVNFFQGPSLEAVTKWRENFLQEAKSLAKLSHLPGVVGVKDFFHENNTTYIILEYLEGQDLKHYAKSLGGKIPSTSLLPAMEPIITSMAEVHKQGIIHRDISPDNIMLLPGGKMKLLDFGAARSFLGSGEKSLSVMLKPGYAPEEQYRSKGKQGPWSDVYAMAGTIYKCLTGVTPPESMDRLHKDELVPPNQLGANLTPQQEAALMKALAVHAENRYQSMEEFHAGLYQGVPVQNSPVMPVQSAPSAPRPGMTVASPVPSAPVQNPVPEPSNDKKTLLIIVCGVLGGVILLLSLIFAFSIMGRNAKKASKNQDQNKSKIEAEALSEEEEQEEYVEEEAQEETESESEDGSDYLALYSEFVNQHKGANIAFAYINDDDIPECIVENKGFVQLLTIEDGAVKEERKSSEYEGGTGREDILFFNEYSGNYAVVIHREDAGALEEIHIFKMGEEEEKGSAFYAGLTTGDPTNDPYGAYTQFYAGDEKSNMYDYARYLEVYMEGMDCYDRERYCGDVDEAMNIYNENPNGDYYYDANSRLPQADYFTVLDEDLEPMSEQEMGEAILQIMGEDGDGSIDSEVLQYIASWKCGDLDPDGWFGYLSDVQKENMRRIARYMVAGVISYA